MGGIGIIWACNETIPLLIDITDVEQTIIDNFDLAVVQ
jgi:hypothetical protein